MSAWIVLHRYPLAYAQRGPCVTVSASDFAAYQHDVATGQSSVKIAEGLTLCEGILLRGLFVHSAGDYVELLVKLMGMNPKQFVALMNRDAAALGLHHTHYVDYTGISPGDISTARDQAMLAVDLMSHEQIVRQIVALTEVALPVAGEVYTYTPLLGNYGVIGVKSGYTGAAGGCDVMAINVVLNHSLYVTYAAVLGQHGADPLALAGQAALVLSRKLRASMAVIANRSSRVVKWIGSPYDLAWRS